MIFTYKEQPRLPLGERINTYVDSRQQLFPTAVSVDLLCGGGVVSLRFQDGPVAGVPLKYGGVAAECTVQAPYRHVAG